MCAVNHPLLNLMVHKNIFRSVILKWSCPSCQLVHHPSSKRNLQFFSQNQAYYNLSFVLFLSCHNCVKNRHNCSVSILGYLNNCVLCTFPLRYRIIFLQLFHWDWKLRSYSNVDFLRENSDHILSWTQSELTLCWQCLKMKLFGWFLKLCVFFIWNGFIPILSGMSTLNFYFRHVLYPSLPRSKSRSTTK